MCDFVQRVKLLSVNIKLTQKKLLEGIYFHKVTHYCLLHGSPLYSMNNALIRPVKKMPLSTLFRLDRYPESLQSEHAHQTGPRRFHESNLLWKTQTGRKSQLDLCQFKLCNTSRTNVVPFFYSCWLKPNRVIMQSGVHFSFLIHMGPKLCLDHRREQLDWVLYFRKAFSLSLSRVCLSAHPC